MWFENQSDLSIHGVRDGILFVLSYSMLGFSAELIVAILFMSLLVIITVSDIAYMLIPNKVLLPFAVVLIRVTAGHST